MAGAISKVDQKWMAESDANTLAEAAQIMEDKARLKRAKEKAKKMAADESDRAKAMRKVANMTVNGKDSKKSEPKKSRRSSVLAPPLNVFQRLQK